MATIARAPQYRPYAAKKAQLRTATPTGTPPVEPQPVAPTAAPVQAKLRSASAPAPQDAQQQQAIASATGATSAPRAAVAATPAASAAPAAVPVPQTFDTQAARNQATASYGLTLADVNHAIYEAALKYGGVPSVTQFGQTWDPNATFDPAHPLAGLQDTTSSLDVTPNDPLSALAGANRDWSGASRSDKDNMNANGAFFSGHELVNQQNLLNTKDRTIEQARRDYEEAVQTLTSQLLQARQGRDNAFTGALGTEIQHQASLTPLPEASSVTPPAAAPDDTPPAAATPAAASPPRPTGSDWDGNNVFLQDSGSRQGQWYRVVKKGTKSYRFYQNGDKVEI